MYRPEVVASAGYQPSIRSRLSQGYSASREYALSLAHSEVVLLLICLSVLNRIWYIFLMRIISYSQRSLPPSFWLLVTGVLCGSGLTTADVQRLVANSRTARAARLTQLPPDLVPPISMTSC